jgi:hypothetical protein
VRRRGGLVEPESSLSVGGHERDAGLGGAAGHLDGVGWERAVQVAAGDRSAVGRQGQGARVADRAEADRPVDVGEAADACHSGGVELAPPWSVSVMVRVPAASMPAMTRCSATRVLPVVARIVAQVAPTSRAITTVATGWERATRSASAASPSG